MEPFLLSHGKEKNVQMGHAGKIKIMTPQVGGASRHRRLFGAGGRAGFSAAELIVVIAVVGVLFTMTIPFFLRYYQAAAVKSASQQVVALLNQARGLAVQQNSTAGVCVHLPSTTQMQFVVDGCGGTVWIGPWTDAAGNINLPQGFTMGPATDVVFDYLGAALPAVTYTVTNAATGATLNVSIAISGQIKITAP
jgi:prepilin-type N-terminal cleavage/methylation domain-containing protein